MADMMRILQEMQWRIDVLTLIVQARPPAHAGVPPPAVEDEIRDPYVVVEDATRAAIPKPDAAKDMTLETKIEKIERDYEKSQGNQGLHVGCRGTMLVSK